jgi:hypothetical protein
LKNILKTFLFFNVYKALVSINLEFVLIYKALVSMI